MGSRREKVSYPNNEVVPHGNFEGGSNYQLNYIENKVTKNPQFRP